MKTNQSRGWDLRLFVCFVVLLFDAGVPAVFSQQSYARVDIRCLRNANLIAFKATDTDTNVVIGYAAERTEGPRATIAAQEPVSTNWTPVTFQFSVAQNDSVKLILRGRYRETEPTGELVPEWVWVDNVSITDTNGVNLVRNGSFEKLGFDGRPEKWGYKGARKEVMSDKTRAFPQNGERCIKVWHSLAAFYDFRARSNQWYTVRAFFRAD
jgi:hypothetical protein